MCRSGRVESGRSALSAHLEMALPPSVNVLWFNRPGVGRVRTTAYQRWAESAGWEIASQRPPHVAGDVAVSIRAGRPSRRRDLDGCLKALLDILVSQHVIHDDRHVETLTASWDATLEPGRCHVTVQQIGGAP